MKWEGMWSTAVHGKDSRPAPHSGDVSTTPALDKLSGTAPRHFVKVNLEMAQAKDNFVCKDTSKDECRDNFANYVRAKMLLI